MSFVVDICFLNSNSNEIKGLALIVILTLFSIFSGLNLAEYSKILQDYKPVHRGAFCQFPFRWIYFYTSNKFTGKETGKTHLCMQCAGWKSRWP